MNFSLIILFFCVGKVKSKRIYLPSRHILEVVFRIFKS